jgi:hypothetical protein
VFLVKLLQVDLNCLSFGLALGTVQMPSEMLSEETPSRNCFGPDDSLIVFLRHKEVLFPKFQLEGLLKKLASRTKNEEKATETI